MFLDLRETGETCSKHRVARLRRANGFRALHGYRTRRWEVSKPAVLTPDLLKRQFLLAKANAAWATEITYVRTWHGWPYLAVVIDLFLNALASAVKQRRPRGTIIHSDQGMHCGRDAWRRFCRANQLEPSMSRKGNCGENAVVELCFSSLKEERIEKRIYPTRDLALADIADDIDAFCNRMRQHSHLGRVSPKQFEEAQKHRRGRG